MPWHQPVWGKLQASWPKDNANPNLGGIGMKHRRQRGSPVQEHRDQIRRALKQAIEPVVCFQGPPPGITNRATNPISRWCASTNSEASAFPQLLQQAHAVGECERRDRTPGGRQPPLKPANPPDTSTAPPAHGAGPTAPPAAPDTAPPHAILTNYSPSGALGPQPLRSSSQAAR